MGFQSMRELNEALLAKQGWRLFTNENSLVFRVLKGKYYPRSSFLHAKAQNSASYIWKSILGAQRVLDQVYRWRIRNGIEVHIWGDRWIGHSRQQMALWPRPSSCELEYVSELVDHDSHTQAVNLIKELFESSQAKIIIFTALFQRLVSNRLIWPMKKTNMFTVRSAYHWLRDNYQQGEASSSQCKIYQKKAWVLNIHL